MLEQWVSRQETCARSSTSSYHSRWTVSRSSLLCPVRPGQAGEPLASCLSLRALVRWGRLSSRVDSVVAGFVSLLSLVLICSYLKILFLWCCRGVLLCVFSLSVVVSNPHISRSLGWKGRLSPSYQRCSVAVIIFPGWNLLSEEWSVTGESRLFWCSVLTLYNC